MARKRCPQSASNWNDERVQAEDISRLLGVGVLNQLEEPDPTRRKAMHKSLLSRRTLLRGLGVSMALPWMESVRAFAEDAKDAAELNQPPTRMAILFSGCG